MELRTWWAHWKLQWIKSEKEFIHILENYLIPCKGCDQPFKSYIHYGELWYVYDTHCNKCKEVEKC